MWLVMVLGWLTSGDNVKGVVDGVEFDRVDLGVCG